MAWDELGNSEVFHVNNNTVLRNDSGIYAFFSGAPVVPQVSMASGWNPAYGWYAADPLAAEYNWPQAYSAVDTQSLLQLLAVVGTPPTRTAPVPSE